MNTPSGIGFVYFASHILKEAVCVQECTGIDSKESIHGLLKRLQIGLIAKCLAFYTVRMYSTAILSGNEAFFV